jgi:type 1 glutamine amidotransferase
MSKVNVYTGHPVIRSFKVKIVNPDHPITNGVRDFVVTDEQHFMTYDKDPKFVLARSINEDGLEYTDMAGAAIPPRPPGLTTTAKGESTFWAPDT